jgi:hypothetical protein
MCICPALISKPCFIKAFSHLDRFRFTTKGSTGTGGAGVLPEKAPDRVFSLAGALSQTVTG